MFRSRPMLARSIAAALSIATIVIGSAGCGKSGDSLGSGRTTTARVDDFGDTIVSAATPRRIVSLNPTTTELLFVLGAGARLVGRTHWDNWPDSARFVPDLGDGLRPNIEAVLATRPDLVVLYASADNRDARERLRVAGVRTIGLKIDRIAEFRRATALLGTVVGDTARARMVVDSVSATLARVQKATASLTRPTVFWHVWDAPLIGIGGGSFMNELIEIAGGRNVYGDLASPAPQISFEDLLRRDPDVILAGQTGAEQLRTSAQWRDVRAIRAGHLYVMDTTLTGRPSVRLGEAATALARLLHPDVAAVRSLPISSGTR